MKVEACDECLRRSRLVGILAPYIEKVATGDGRSRSPQLLALGDEELVEAVAPNHAARLLREARAAGGKRLRREVQAAGSWAVCRHDPAFPPGLVEAPDGPAALICRGDRGVLPRLAPSAAVTIVGARRCTSYGREVATGLAEALARSGLVVVSGMAHGIDGAAHAGALRGGTTVAVLGCAAERPYPARHRALHRQIAQRGLVVSELPPGTSPWRWSFPARNRIMAAMAEMTVVVEAAVGSGSLITAELAQEAGRTVGAVPGQTTTAVAAGSNELLHAGAHVIRSAQDVLDCMLGTGAVALAPAGPPLDGPLASALDACEADEPTATAVAARLGLDAAEAAAALARLELLGYLRASLVGTYTRTSLIRPDSDPARSVGSGG